MADQSKVEGAEEQSTTCIQDGGKNKQARSRKKKTLNVRKISPEKGENTNGEDER